jgi:hypothetical protein
VGRSWCTARSWSTVGGLISVFASQLHHSLVAGRVRLDAGEVEDHRDRHERLADRLPLLRLREVGDQGGDVAGGDLVNRLVAERVECAGYVAAVLQACVVGDVDPRLEPPARDLAERRHRLRDREEREVRDPHRGVYVPYGGHIFDRAGVIVFDDQRDLAFYVNRAGDIGRPPGIPSTAFWFGPVGRAWRGVRRWMAARVRVSRRSCRRTSRPRPRFG